MTPEAEKKQEIPQPIGTNPDIFDIQKTNILNNPEFQGLEKETKNLLDIITTYYQQPGDKPEEQETNIKILDFLQKDNNLEKAFQNYAENFLKDKEIFDKKRSLKKDFGIIKDKIQEDYDQYEKVQNKDKEAVVQDKEAVVQDKEAVVQDKEAVVQDKEAVEKTIQQEKKEEKTSIDIKEKYRETLFENIKPEYKNLQKNNPITIDKNSPEYKKLQDNKELKERFGDKFEDFINYQYVATKIAQEVQKDPEKKVSSENYRFIQSFNAIAREYKQQEIDTKGREIIPEKTLTRSISDFTNNPNTSAILEQNKSVENHINKTQNSIKINESSLPKEDIFQKQTLKLNGENIKKDLKDKKINYDSIFNQKGEKIENERNKLSPEQKKIIEKTISKYKEQIKSDLNNSLQKLIASKTIAGCTNEFVRYFNFNKQENNYGDMGFDVDKINIENGNLQKTMNFKGSETVFNYDLNSGEIKHSDFLNVKNNIVTFGTNKFEDFPIKFPSIESIQKDAKDQK